MSAQRDEDRVWRALAHPMRRAILDHLVAQQRTTGQLIEHFDSVGRVAVMKHLDILAEVGLILVRREGRVRWNWLNPVPIQQVCDRWISRHVRRIASAMTRLKAHAERRQPDDSDPEQPNAQGAQPPCPSKKNKRASAATSSKSRSRRRGSGSGKR